MLVLRQSLFIGFFFLGFTYGFGFFNDIFGGNRPVDEDNMHREGISPLVFR